MQSTYFVSNACTYIFCRKGVAVKAKYIPKSIYYNFQWLCLFLLLVETPVRFVVLWGYVNNIVAGVDILYLCIR